MTGDEDDGGDDDDVTAGTRGSRFGIRTPALKYLLQLFDLVKMI